MYDLLSKMIWTDSIHVFMYRSATCNHTDWTETGYGAYFSYKDLVAQGMLSSDKLQPWKRLQDPIMKIARKFKQVYILVWYPYQFGAKDDATAAKSAPNQRHRHENIIQTVIPTRTGMDGLKSTTAVWLTARNSTAPTIPPRMYRAPADELEQDSYVTVDNF